MSTASSMTTLDRIKNFTKRPAVKKVLGVAALLAGIFALLTPFTPGSWLIFIGLELLGIRLLFIDKIKRWLGKKQTRP